MEAILLYSFSGTTVVTGGVVNEEVVIVVGELSKRGGGT